jgi:hypothetical protein
MSMKTKDELFEAGREAGMLLKTQLLTLQKREC